MIHFKAVIKKFNEQGEKTGWTYIEVPEPQAQQLLPGNKKSFRVKGQLDNYSYEKVALLPMGDGHFIMPLNAAMRKGIKKQKGATVQVKMQVDKEPINPPEGFMECLHDDPDALAYFTGLTLSHRNYFFKWISSAKTAATRDKRIVQAVIALGKKQDFVPMLRSLKKNKEDSLL